MRHTNETKMSYGLLGGFLEIQLTIFLMKSSKSPRLVPLDIVPCDPQSRHTPPKWPGKLRERMEEAVVDDLVKKLGQDICR